MVFADGLIKIVRDENLYKNADNITTDVTGFSA